MGRPRRIKKKNSILFTTKHHSFNGIIGTVLLVMCLLVMGTSISYAFHDISGIDESFGYYGFLTALLNVLGLIAGIMGYKERDSYKGAPITAIVGNSAMLIIWILLIVLSK